MSSPKACCLPAGVEALVLRSVHDKQAYYAQAGQRAGQAASAPAEPQLPLNTRSARRHGAAADPGAPVPAAAAAEPSDTPMHAAPATAPAHPLAQDQRATHVQASAGLAAKCSDATAQAPVVGELATNGCAHKGSEATEHVLHHRSNKRAREGDQAEPGMPLGKHDRSGSGAADPFPDAQRHDRRRAGSSEDGAGSLGTGAVVDDGREEGEVSDGA